MCLLIIAGKDCADITNGDVVIMREILRRRCIADYRNQMVVVLSRVVDSVRPDIDPIHLDKTIESICLKLTRKPSRRAVNSQPQPNKLWHKKFVRRTRSKRPQTNANCVNYKRSRRTTRAPLSTTRDMRRNRETHMSVKILQDKQQNHVKSMKDSGAVCYNGDEDHVCSICLHSTAEQKESDVARLDCFHEFCRPCIEYWFVVDRKQVHYYQILLFSLIACIIIILHRVVFACRRQVQSATNLCSCNPLHIHSAVHVVGIPRRGTCVTMFTLSCLQNEHRVGGSTTTTI